MVVGVRTVIYGALVLIFYTALQGGKYYLNNRIQELGLLLAICLLVYTAMLAAFNVRDKDLNWSGWVLGTLLFVGYTFILPGYVFSKNANVAMMPSVFASREFLIVLVCPAIYFLVKIGYEIEQVESAFSTALIILLLSYLLFRFTLPLESMFNSPNPAVKGLVTYDDWRGYRLRPPWSAFIYLVILAPIKWYQAKGVQKTFWMVITALIFIGIAIQGARSAMAAIFLGVFCYNAFFATKPRLGLFFFALPVIVSGMTAMTYFYFLELSEAPLEGDGVRWQSYLIAWEQIREHPVLGFGVQSAYTITEQQLFWKKFYSADIGIVGIAFRYGILGAVIYQTLVIYCARRAIIANWHYRDLYGKANPIFIAMICKFSGDIFKYLLSIDYSYIHGLVSASLLIALSAIYKQRWKIKRDEAIAAASASQPPPNLVTA